ncbi:MAG: IPT/TIG domain-containing protein, partial [Planctomycetes bacterium]|nr:IPT/TIG domain-containing protein [Planctomycetota bacterium]
MSTPKLAGSFLLLALGSWAQAQTPTVESLPNAFRDLSGSQSAVALPVENRDEGGVPILIGFDFTFYGQTYSQVTVATNGYLTFGTAIAPLNEPIPSDFPPNTLLAPFWDDLDLRPNPDAKLLFERYGSAPNRVLTIQWQEVAFKADPAARLSFQVLLFEGTNEVQFHYGSMRNGDGSEGVGLASGASATIGIEAGDGLEGLELAFNQAGVIDSHIRGFAFQQSGYAVPQGRVLGDLDGDGRITVLDQSRLAELGNVRYPPGSAAELILADVGPVASDATTLWGDQDLNAYDRDVLTDVILERRALNPYLSGVSPLSQTPGASVTLVGSAFDPVAANNLVSFSGLGGARVTVPAEAVDAAGSQLTVTVPASARRGVVFVTARGLRTNPRVFGVSGIPAILEFEPAVGVVGAEVAIVGLEFPQTVGDATVTIGGQVAAVTTVLAGPQPGQTTILATVPALAPGVHAVTVATGAAVSEPVEHPFGDLPLAQLDLPAEGAEVRSIVEVSGSASDPSD